jgi:hypothetical protein
MGETITTTDHDRIKNWAEERGGAPAFVSDTHSSHEDGILRIAFQNEEDLQKTDWDTFFGHFEENGLAALLQDETADGSTSRFVKFINRNS